MGRIPLRWIWHGLIVIALTLLTQLGGIAWGLSRLTKHKLLAFLGLYAALSVAALFIAPLTGRVPLSCTDNGALQMRAGLYCALNRHYVTPELAEVLDDLAHDMQDRHPGTITQVLDAGFPFVTGMPLLPHLSHDDGEKADIAFFYAKGGTYLPAQTRSPIGYFAFEDGPSQCPKTRATLRWDIAWLQSLWPNWTLDIMRTAYALRLLVRDDRVDKLFIEPHLARSLGVQNRKIRFQGCHAARHDDHIHIQL